MIGGLSFLNKEGRNQLMYFSGVKKSRGDLQLLLRFMRRF